MRLTAFILIVAASAAPASADTWSTRVWVDVVMSRLPFTDNALTRENYGTYANAFADERRSHLDLMFGRLLKRSEDLGLKKRAARLKEDHERRIRRLTDITASAAETTFKTLDADANGVVTKAEALSVLTTKAQQADLDDDGYLDGEEQRLAEWSLTTGTKIAEKKDRIGIYRQFVEIENTDQFP